MLSLPFKMLGQHSQQAKQLALAYAPCNATLRWLMHDWAAVISLWRKLRCAVDLRVEDPLVGSIAQQYITDREAHDKQAAEWTRRFAQG